MAVVVDVPIVAGEAEHIRPAVTFECTFEHRGVCS